MGWAGFAGLVATYGLAVFLGGAVGLWIDTLLFVLVVGGSSVACAWMATRVSRAERRFWVFLTAVNALTLAAQAWYGWYLAAIDPAGPGIPSVNDLFSLLAAGALVAFVVSIPASRHWEPTAAVQHVIDVVALSVAAYAGLSLWYVAPLLHGTPLDGGAAVWSAAGYPLVGAFLLGSTYVILVDVRPGRRAPWENAIGGALTVYGIGLLAWPVFRVTADYDVMNLSAVLYALTFLSGHYLLLVAAALRREGGAKIVAWRHQPRSAMHYRPLGVVAPFVLLALSVGFALRAFDAGAPAEERAPAAVAAASIAVLLTVRSVVLVFENAQLRSQAARDPLTGLEGPHELSLLLAEEIESARRFGEGVALLFLDLDGFSSLNTRLGPHRADVALRSFAKLIEGCAPRGSSAFRMEGDRFAVLLPASLAESARTVANRMRTAVSSMELPGPARLTVSIGVAAFPEDALDERELLARSQAACVHAKSHGKDRVERFDAITTQPRPTVASVGNDRAGGEQLAAIRSLAVAVDARERTKQSHSRNVARLAVMFAEELGYPAARVERIEVAALLHDVGKIGVSDSILAKRGPLGPTELREMRRHALLGERILSGVGLDDIVPWVRHHHERWDGTGYPDGLAGDAIPEEARVLALCDAYEALTSDRPYRSAVSASAALQEIDLHMGTQFDPGLADAFIGMMGRLLAARSDITRRDVG